MNHFLNFLIKGFNLMVPEYDHSKSTEVEKVEAPVEIVSEVAKLVAAFNIQRDILAISQRNLDVMDEEDRGLIESIRHRTIVFPANISTEFMSVISTHSYVARFPI